MSRTVVKNPDLQGIALAAGIELETKRHQIPNLKSVAVLLRRKDILPPEKRRPLGNCAVDAPRYHIKILIAIPETDFPADEIILIGFRDIAFPVQRQHIEVVNGKKETQYDLVQKEIKKDKPSRLHARRQMLKVLYPVKEVPAEAAGRKKNTKQIDLPAKLFDEIAPKYAGRNGGYTRIVKLGQRRGDGAMEVVLELV